MSFRRAWIARASFAVLLAACLLAGAARAAEPAQVRVNVFPGAQNLALFVGAAKGVFEKRGLKNGLKEGQDYTVEPVGGSLIRMKAVVSDRKYAAVVLNVPWSIVAEQSGLKSLGRTVDLLGPYQASGAFVMRPWAQANAALLERYLAAYVEALRWALDPANRAEAAALLTQRLKLAPDVAGKAYDLMREPKFGLATDARFDLEGFRNLLAIRAQMEGQWGGKPPAPDKYFDLQYYERAMKALSR